MYKFEKLEIWELSLQYMDLIYKIAEKLPKSEDYNLKSQFIRAGTSISLNIAEGSMGQTDPEQSRFLGISLRSLIETVACQSLIKRRNYPNIDQELLTKAYRESQKLAKKIQSMRNKIGPDKSRIHENGPHYLTDDNE